LYNTTAGRDIGALIDPAAPALRSTSIHGYWIGPVEKHRQGGGDMVESGTDLEIDMVDFTGSPSVTGAQIRSVAYESTTARAAGRDTITESGEATITPVTAVDDIVDERNPVLERYSETQRRAMAGRGQAMADGRYAIATKG